uniref:RRM domain-containing protein n=1 Tax=Romanomermis culicivorax TaxID=13658 RepID=A0A915KUD1_ROMCU
MNITHVQVCIWNAVIQEKSLPMFMELPEPETVNSLELRKHLKFLSLIKIRNDKVRISRTNNYSQNRQQRYPLDSMSRFLTPVSIRDESLPDVSYENAEDDDICIFNARRNVPIVGQSSSAASVFSRLSNVNHPHQDIGFKVDVSNLSDTVSDEDIRELFSSIGPLLNSRLVRAGDACAIFESLADAKRAIAEFNNRELDDYVFDLGLSLLM